MEKHDTTHQSWSASVQYLINGGPCYHGNVYHTNEGYVGQRVTATTVRLFMYGSFGATGISPSNMMHILSDEEKHRWKSLQAVDYCLWVFVFGKESFSTVYGRSSPSLMCCLFFFFFRFPNFGWTSVSALSTMHTRLPVSMNTAVSIPLDID